MSTGDIQFVVVTNNTKLDFLLHSLKICEERGLVALPLPFQQFLCNPTGAIQLKKLDSLNFLPNSSHITAKNDSKGGLWTNLLRLSAVASLITIVIMNRHFISFINAENNFFEQISLNLSSVVKRLPSVENLFSMSGLMWKVPLTSFGVLLGLFGFSHILPSGLLANSTGALGDESAQSRPKRNSLRLSSNARSSLDNSTKAFSSGSQNFSRNSQIINSGNLSLSPSPLQSERTNREFQKLQGDFLSMAHTLEQLYTTGELQNQPFDVTDICLLIQRNQNLIASALLGSNFSLDQTHTILSPLLQCVARKGAPQRSRYPKRRVIFDESATKISATSEDEYFSAQEDFPEGTASPGPRRQVHPRASQKSHIDDTQGEEEEGEEEEEKLSEEKGGKEEGNQGRAQGESVTTFPRLHGAQENDPSIVLNAPRELLAEFESGLSLFQIAKNADKESKIFLYKDRLDMADVSSKQEFAYHVYWLRSSFSELVTDPLIRDEFFCACREMVSNLIRIVDQTKVAPFQKSYNEFFMYLEANIDEALRDAAQLPVRLLNIFDFFLEYTLIDSLRHLDQIPNGLKTMLQWSWESAKSTIITNFVNKTIDEKIVAAKKNKFRVKYLTAMKSVTPVLALGFLNSNTKVSSTFFKFKAEITDYYKKLFSIDLANCFSPKKHQSHVLLLSRQTIENCKVLLQ